MKIYVYISILCVEFSSSLDLSKVVGNISIFQNEICSYSGEPQIISNQINFTCAKGYKTKQNPYDTFYDVPIQCNYRQKKRFVTFFLSLFIPFGFDYLYLGRYWVFALVFVVILIILSNSFICYIYVNNFQTEVDTLTTANVKHRERFDSQRDSERYISSNIVSMKENSDDRERCSQIYQTVNFILIGIAIIAWIINAIFMGLGKISDANGFETESDMEFLFKVKSK